MSGEKLSADELRDIWWTSDGNDGVFSPGFSMESPLCGMAEWEIVELEAALRNTGHLPDTATGGERG
jgi:hypothetical protein